MRTLSNYLSDLLSAITNNVTLLMAIRAEQQAQRTMLLQQAQVLTTQGLQLTQLVDVIGTPGEEVQASPGLVALVDYCQRVRDNSVRVTAEIQELLKEVQQSL